ncbi:MAG: sulfatase-like hydrolase/transferase, partial [Tannerella sp.]|nr:sulfatase-like hydrolase/transferase [Tannerella sp.]
SAAAQYSPTPAFQGVIGKTLADTKESIPQVNPKAPEGAPNIVWIHIDDIGYGAITSFGGLIETPNIDRLANQGVAFANHHTCAFSAPTRAALLTGRNNHSVHFGYFAHNSFNTPGYDGYLPFETGTVGEILRENGYNTFALGKYHLTHPSDATQAGPFNRWPTNRGFDHYFGFPPEAWGTDQWNPILYRDTHRVPDDPQRRHVTTLLADEAISYIANQKSAAPEKPFFLYFSTGAGHSPHQVSKEWIEKYKGYFDGGWDKYREETLKRQKALGVVPADVTLPPFNNAHRTWESLTPDEKRLNARFMEVYAGFISHTDYEVGRIIDFIEQIGQLDNTLVIVLVGDNGAEGGGREYGNFLPYPREATKDQIIEKFVKNIDLLGAPQSSALYPSGWAEATNTPFRYYKGNSAWEGGTHDPLIIFYPKKIKDKGGIRHQYTHVNDILPTTLELAGAVVPASINGYPQRPLEGVSFAYALSPENKNAYERHTIQYNETTGGYSIYKDGWKAAFQTANYWYNNRATGGSETIHLYNVREDFNELNDLAAKYPEKLKELLDVFEAEAWKYNVYPLKSSWDITNRNIFNGRDEVILYEGSYLSPFSIPAFINRITTPNNPSAPSSYSITADVVINNAKDAGVLLAIGGYVGGLSFYIKDGTLHYDYNSEGKIIKVTSGKKISAGAQKLKALIKQESGSTDRSVTLYINDSEVGDKHFSINVARHSTEGLEIGRDLGSPATDAYNSPFAFTGKINSVTIEAIK